MVVNGSAGKGRTQVRFVPPSTLRETQHRSDGSSKTYLYQPSQQRSIHYPPTPVSNECVKEAVLGAAQALAPNTCEEGACAVCAQLVPARKLTLLSE
ncbi:hypothetical protein CYLTODRAFT_361094, partial [Cylindrobasidium torrendii FP15055 ss-10]